MNNDIQIALSITKDGQLYGKTYKITEMCTHVINTGIDDLIKQATVEMTNDILKEIQEKKK